MTWVSANGIDAPGWKVTMFTCMSWRMSSASTKRVVAQAPSVSGIDTGSTSWSEATKHSGASKPSRG